MSVHGDTGASFKALNDYEAPSFTFIKVNDSHVDSYEKSLRGVLLKVTLML